MQKSISYRIVTIITAVFLLANMMVYCKKAALIRAYIRSDISYSKNNTAACVIFT